MNKSEIGPRSDSSELTNEEIRLQNIHERVDLLKANIEKIEILLGNQDLSNDDSKKLSNVLKLVQEELGKSNFVIDRITKDINISSK